MQIRMRNFLLQVLVWVVTNGIWLMTLTGFQQSPLLTGLFYLKVKGPYGNACKINTFSCLHEYEYVQKNNCLHKNKEMEKKYKLQMLQCLMLQNLV